MGHVIRRGCTGMLVAVLSGTFLLCQRNVVVDMSA